MNIVGRAKGLLVFAKKNGATWLALSLLLSIVAIASLLDGANRTSSGPPSASSRRRLLWGRSGQVERNFLDPKSVELRDDLVADKTEAAPLLNVQYYGLAVNDMPALLNNYVTEPDFDAAYHAAQEVEPVGKEQPLIQPYTMEDALSESQVFRKSFALIIYDPSSDNFLWLHNKNHVLANGKLWDPTSDNFHLNCPPGICQHERAPNISMPRSILVKCRECIGNSVSGKLFKSVNALVYMLRHLFPDRFTPTSPELVLAVAAYDYPLVDTSKLPHTNGASPLLMFGSVFRNAELYPNMIAMPMPDTSHLDCFETYYTFGKKVCNVYSQLVFGNGLTYQWDHLIVSLFIALD